jgi:hypothetical protein
MLKDSGCSIYEHRPRTCRDFDCRTLAATTLVLDHAQQAIAEQAQRWRFEYPRDEDDRQHVAVRATAAFLLERGPELLPGLLPSHPLQLAMLAVCVYDVLYALGDGSQQTRPPDDELARAILTAMARGEDDETPARAISVKRGPGDQP